MARRRWQLVLALLLTVAVGVASRKLYRPTPYCVKEAGDALWAVAIYLVIALLWPAARVRWVAAIALAIAWATELLQLCRAPWMNHLRHGPVGWIVGGGFSWVDMSMYVVGVAICLAGELARRDRGAAGDLRTSDN